MLDLSENLRPQKSHSNFFSVLCVNMWVFSVREIVPQTSHCSSFSSLLTRIIVPSKGLSKGDRGFRPRRGGAAMSLVGQEIRICDEKSLDLLAPLDFDVGLIFGE